MIERTAQALDERSHTAPFGIRALRYIFPDHWSFLLGEIALYCFIVLVATGTYLALFFDPSTAQTVYHGGYAPLDGAQMTQAYRSTVHLSLDVKAGLLMRQTHHWAADVFVAAIALHLMRIVFTGAFRKPRELTYYVGLTILILALLEGYLGYSLVDDLLSGMGLAIGYGVALSIPFVGASVAALVWGGPFPGAPEFWSRMYIAHVLRVPAPDRDPDRHPSLPDRLAAPHPVPGWEADRETPSRRPRVPRPGAALARAHVRRLRRAVSAWRARPDQPDLALGAVSRRRRHERRAAGLVPGLADRRAAADAGIRRDHRRPDLIPNPFWGGVVFPSIVFGTLFLWPTLERRFARDRGPHNLVDRPRDAPRRTAFATALLAWVFVIFMAGSADRAYVLLGWSYETQIEVYRVLVFVVPVIAYWLARRVCRELLRNERVAQRRHDAEQEAAGD